MDDVEGTGRRTTNIRYVTTKKFLNEDDQLGTLPDVMNEFFNSFETNILYLRKGTSTGQSTFLECILFAKNVENYKRVSIEERNRIIEREREALSEMSEYNFAKQECYDMTSTDIREQIKDINIYLEPRKYIKILEKRYNIDIYLFTRDNENTNYTLPRHINGYYRNYKEPRESVIVYEHNGGLWTSNSKCELIVRKTIIEKTPDKSIFSPNDEVVEELIKLELQLDRFFVFQKPIIRTVIPPGIIQKQYIDNYGKLRIVLTDGIYIFTSPCEPVNKPLMEIDESFHENQFDQVMEYIRKYNLEIYSQTMIDSVIKEIIIKYNNQFFTVPVTPSREIDDIPVFPNSIIPRNGSDNVLENFITMERYSRQLFEMVLYEYSYYLNNLNQEHTPQHLDRFFNEKIKIDGNIQYNLFDYKLSRKTLSVINRDILKNIKYNVNVTINNNNIDRIKNYYTQDFMSNYYKNIYDFKKYPHTIILKGNQSIFQWLDNVSTYKMSDKLEIYDNETIEYNGEVYYIFPATSIQNGVYIGKIWREYGYIPVTGEEEQSLQYKITHYFPRQEREPSTKKRGNIVNKFDIKLQGIVEKYKKTKYQVLLNISYKKDPTFIRYENNNYLLQLAEDLDFAKKISYYYDVLGYNPYNINKLDDLETELQYKLYVTNSEGEISGTFVIEGEENENNMKIIKHSIMGKSIFFAMLKI